MASNVSFPTAPEINSLDIGTISRAVRVINNIMIGKTNNRGSVTLSANATSTVVVDPIVGGGSVILLSPMSANASQTQVYIMSTDKETFTLGHDSSADTDRTFDYVVIG